VNGNKRVICRGEISSTVKGVALNFFSFFFFGAKLFNHRRRQSNSLENQALPVGSRLEREIPLPTSHHAGSNLGNRIANQP
jgi:hypothetical protein